MLPRLPSSFATAITMSLRSQSAPLYAALQMKISSRAASRRPPASWSWLSSSSFAAPRLRSRATQALSTGFSRSGQKVRGAQILRKARHGEVDESPPRAPDELLGDQLFAHDGCSADARVAGGAGGVGALVGAVAETGDGDQVALLGVGGELERGREEAALEAVVDDLFDDAHVLGGDRWRVDLIPQHTPVLLQEVRVPTGARDDQLDGCVAQLNALQPGGPHEREPGLGVGELPERVVGEQPRRVRLADAQHAWQRGQPGSG